MPSAPITSPSPGQLVRSAVSFTLWVSVSPQFTVLGEDVAAAEPAPASAATSVSAAIVALVCMDVMRPPFRRTCCVAAGPDRDSL